MKPIKALMCKGVKNRKIPIAVTIAATSSPASACIILSIAGITILYSLDTMIRKD